MQTRLAAGNFLIPVVKGAEAGLNNAFMRNIAAEPREVELPSELLRPGLGPSVGRVVNDVTAEIAGGSMTPQAGRQGDPGRLEAGQLTVRERLRRRPRPPRCTRSSSRVGCWRVAPAVGDGRLAALVLFLPPALLLFTLFVVLPIGEAAWYSGFNWNGFGRPTNWIGFDNYRFVFETPRLLAWRCATTA